MHFRNALGSIHTPRSRKSAVQGTTRSIKKRLLSLLTVGKNARNLTPQKARLYKAAQLLFRSQTYGIRNSDNFQDNGEPKHFLYEPILNLEANEEVNCRFISEIVNFLSNQNSLRECTFCAHNISGTNFKDVCKHAKRTIKYYLEHFSYRADVKNILKTFLYTNIDFSFSNCSAHCQFVKDLLIQACIKIFVQNFSILLIKSFSGKYAEHMWLRIQLPMSLTKNIKIQYRSMPQEDKPPLTTVHYKKQSSEEAFHTRSWPELSTMHSCNK